MVCSEVCTVSAESGRGGGQVVAAAPHILLGQELAIDRATPKDRAPAAAYPALAPAAAMNGAPQV